MASQLPLSPPVTVNVNLPTVGATLAGFNLGLIIGPSDIFPLTTRCRKYASTAAILADGYHTNSPEYLAAEKYFAASSKPTQVLIGRQGSGETPLQAITACRAANQDWYLGYIIGASDSDHEAVAAYIQSQTGPYAQYVLDNDDSAVLNNTVGNLFATLDAGTNTRTHGFYSSVQYAGAAVMGYAMGATNHLANSAYTLFGKQLPTVTPETLTLQQVTNIETNHGNVYIDRGNFYNLYEKGVNFGNQWFDTMIYTDMWANMIQVDVMNQLTSVLKIPQTEPGMAQLRTVITNTCETMVKIGFLAPGVWNSSPILTVNTGDYLSTGYRVMSDSIDGQSETDRSNRIAPNIYVLGKTAGAAQDIVINLNINQ